MQMKVKPPCKDCEQRHEACHASCDKYQSWKTKHREDRKRFLQSIQGECEERNFRHERFKD